MRPLGRSNLYENEVCPDESIVCLKIFTIASTGPLKKVDAGRNIFVGGGRESAGIESVLLEGGDKHRWGMGGGVSGGGGVRWSAGEGTDA